MDKRCKRCKDYQERTYESVGEMLVVHRINPMTFYTRKRCGYVKPGFGLLFPTQDKYRGIVRKYEGKVYKSLPDLCEHEIVKYTDVRHGIERLGLTLEDAVARARIPKEQRENNTCNSFEYKGVKYRSQEDFCKKNNEKYAKFQSRMRRRKLSFTQAIDYECISDWPKAIGVTVNGKTYSSIRKCCNDLGLNPCNVSIMKSKYSYSTEEAIQHLINVKEKKKEKKGKKA